MDELKDKVAIVTGAASGIGRAAVELFAREGAVVVAADVTDDAGQALVDRLGACGHTCTYVHADVSSEADVQAMVYLALSQYGRLDVLFNNAGIEGAFTAASDLSLDYATQGIRINCLCPGVIDTPMVERALSAPGVREQITDSEPVGRMGRADEVAQLALFLASDRASFITGAIIPVDGGYVAR